MSAEAFSASVHGEILERISLLLHFIDCPLDRTYLTEARTRISLTPPALKVLGDIDAYQQINNEALPDEHPFLTRAKQAHKKQARKAKGRGPATADRSDAFHALGRLGVSVPSSQESARYVASLLLTELRSDLKVCYISSGSLSDGRIFIFS